MADYYKTEKSNEFINYFEATDDLVAMYLVDKGFASTRTPEMSKAITQMHKAISLLDGRNTELVTKLFPEMVAVAQLYADIFPDCKSWKEDEQ